VRELAFGLDGYREFHLIVREVGSVASQVGIDARSSSHRAHRAVPDSLLSRQDADTAATGGDRAVMCEQWNHRAIDDLADIARDGGHRSWVADVTVHAANAVHGVVDAIAGDRLQHIHYLFAEAEDLHEGGLEADDFRGHSRPKQVECRRSSSETTMRIYWARLGISTPAMRSMAMQ